MAENKRTYFISVSEDLLLGFITHWVINRSTSSMKTKIALNPDRTRSMIRVARIHIDFRILPNDLPGVCIKICKGLCNNCQDGGGAVKPKRGGGHHVNS